MVVASPTEVRYVARVSGAEAKRLRSLHQSAPRVHKSLPEGHPRRQQSKDLSELLARFHRRGVPIDVLADITGVSHQAVRARVTATELEPSAFDLSSIKLVASIDALDKVSDLVLVADSGMHRRLLVYFNPASVSHLRMLTDVPMLTKAEDVISWLESSSGVVTGTAQSATPLRMPPAVYMPKDMVNKVLAELTPA